VEKFARKIFGRKALEGIRGRRKLHNEETHNLNTIRVVESIMKLWAGQMGRVEEINESGMYVGNLLGTTARQGCRWKGDIKINLQKRGC
jgi:hypothetical protein